MEQVWYTAAARGGPALLASLISIRPGISVALVEISLGFVAGNLETHLHTAIFQPNFWINFLAGFDSIVLTFLAEAQIAPEAFRRQLKPSLAIGIVSFMFPFLGAMSFTYLPLPSRRLHDQGDAGHCRGGLGKLGGPGV